MTTYYCGPGGNNGNAGTSWALRKLTLNGVEDIPVAAGDTVYVGPGTYAELLTVDVSGTAGNIITYIGDYTGANTSGTKGIVRITGSNDNITGTRANCITATSKSYRTFDGFVMDGTTTISVDLISCDHITITRCDIGAVFANTGGAISVSGSSQAAITIQKCNIWAAGTDTYSVLFSHSATVDNAGHVVENCIITGGHDLTCVRVSRVGGITVRNCLLQNAQNLVHLVTAVSAGQTVTVNNCIMRSARRGFFAVAADGTLVENYNTIDPGIGTARSNVNTGANSVSRPALVDKRWFFEAVNSGRLITPFDLASYSTLVEYNSGTGAPSTDLRGASVVGTYREWGALEYNANYRTQGPVSIAPIGGIG